MKSVRLNGELEEKLKRAARAAGTSESQFIRDAIARRCDEVLRQSLSDALKDYIGQIHGGGGRANRTGEAFSESLLEKKKLRR